MHEGPGPRQRPRRSTSDVVREALADALGPAALAQPPRAIDRDWIPLVDAVVAVAAVQGLPTTPDALGPCFPRTETETAWPWIRLNEVHELAQGSVTSGPLLIARRALSSLIAELGTGSIRAALVGRDWLPSPIAPEAWRVDPGTRIQDEEDGEIVYIGRNAGCVCLSLGLVLAKVFPASGEPDGHRRRVAALKAPGRPIVLEWRGFRTLLEDLRSDSEHDVHVHRPGVPPTRNPVEPRDITPPSAEPSDADLDVLVARFKGKLNPLRTDVLRAVVRWSARKGLRQLPEAIPWNEVDRIFTSELDGQVAPTDTTDGFRMIAANGDGCDRKGLDFAKRIKPKAKKILEALNSGS